MTQGCIDMPKTSSFHGGWGGDGGSLIERSFTAGCPSWPTPLVTFYDTWRIVLVGPMLATGLSIKILIHVDANWHWCNWPGAFLEPLLLVLLF
jgi:hypothetical protein